MKEGGGALATLLVKNQDIAAIQIDGVSRTEAGHYSITQMLAEPTERKNLGKGHQRTSTTNDDNPRRHG